MKKLLLFVIAIVVATAGFYYISKFLTRTRAAAPAAFVSFQGSLILIEAEQPLGSTDVNRISAFDLTFTTTTGQITQIGEPATFPGADTSIFTPVIAPSGLPSSSVHIVYVIQRPNANLPVSIEIPITTSDAQAKVRLATGATQEVVGYIPSSSQISYQVVSSSAGTPNPTNQVPTNPAVTNPSPTWVPSEYTIEVGTRGVLEFDSKDSGAPTSTLPPGATNTPIPGATTTPVDPNTPHIRFAIVLESAQNLPEIEVRVKVTDLVAAITPAASQPHDTCQQPDNAEIFYENVQMVADGSGVYRPKPSTPFKKGGTTYSISSDGWLPLVDTHAGIAYAIAVKGPKHRSQRMVDTTILQSGKHGDGNFNWSGFPLAPGDLPDPNSGNRQDCTVNALDLARIEGLLAVTDAPSLVIADVNYDGVVNGNDISKVVNTLSTKPDDD